jgi:hypothetical protein
VSTRLQVVIDEAERERFQEAAARRGLSLSEWVRQTLRDAEASAAIGDPRRKLTAIRAAARLEFPVGDIETMLDEIERGYAQDTA